VWYRLRHEPGVQQSGAGLAVPRGRRAPHPACHRRETGQPWHTC